MTKEKNTPNTENAKPLGAKHLIEIEVEEHGTAKAYLKPIPRHTLEAALGHLMAHPPRMLTAGELIYNSCVLQADAIIKEREDVANDFYFSCIELIEKRTATIKKL